MCEFACENNKKSSLPFRLKLEKSAPSARALLLKIMRCVIRVVGLASKQFVRKRRREKQGVKSGGISGTPNLS